MIHADVCENEEQTMARFLAGINHAVKSIVNHHPYNDMIKLLHQAREAERQVIEDARFAARSRSSASLGQPYNNSQPNKSTSAASNSAMRNSASKKPESTPPPVRRPMAPAASSTSSMGSTGRSRDIICHKCKGVGHFQRDCLNVKTMLITEDGGYVSASDDESPNAQAVLHTDDIEQCECDPEFPNTEQYSIVCTPKVLSVMPSPSLEQRCNLFQTWAKLDKGKVGKVIIDGGSCHNLASKDMCHKLGLKYLPHPRPHHV